MTSVLKPLCPSSDTYELKRELSIMHEVNECKGSDINRRIDNYLDKKVKGAQPERYKMKYR